MSNRELIQTLVDDFLDRHGHHADAEYGYRAALDTDWRVLGGVIPGPIPVEWVRVGDTIQDHGVTGVVTRTFTRINRSGGVVHLSIGSGHVSFAKVAQQDFITVIITNHHADGGV